MFARGRGRCDFITSKKGFPFIGQARRQRRWRCPAAAAARVSSHCRGVTGSMGEKRARALGQAAGLALAGTCAAHSGSAQWMCSEDARCAGRRCARLRGQMWWRGGGCDAKTLTTGSAAARVCKHNEACSSGCARRKGARGWVQRYGDRCNPSAFWALLGFGYFYVPFALFERSFVNIYKIGKDTEKISMAPAQG